PRPATNRLTAWCMTTPSLPHPLAPLLGHLLRDALALIQFPPGLGVLQQSFGRSEIAGFHERLHLVLGADVIGWSHFLHLEAFSDDSDRVALLPEGEQGLDGDFRALLGVHRT